MNKLFTTGFCLLVGLSLVSGCGGSGGAIPSGVPNELVTPSLTLSACLAGACASPAALPSGTVGVRYGYRLFCITDFDCNYGALLEAKGGVAPYVAWSSSGLPPGLRLGNFWNRSGYCCPELREVSGSPTTAGTYNFVVTVADSESPPKQVSANYTIIVAP